MLMSVSRKKHYFFFSSDPDKGTFHFSNSCQELKFQLETVHLYQMRTDQLWNQQQEHRMQCNLVDQMWYNSLGPIVTVSTNSVVCQHQTHISIWNQFIPRSIVKLCEPFYELSNSHQWNTDYTTTVTASEDILNFGFFRLVIHNCVRVTLKGQM